jgi:hypothetical protein
VATPACRPATEFDGKSYVLRVGSSTLTLPKEFYGPFPEDLAAVHAYNEQAVLLSARGGSSSFIRDGSSLWLLECGGAHRFVRLHHDETSTFGHSLLSGDGRFLYHPGSNGLTRLDLSTLADDPKQIQSKVILPFEESYRPGCWSGSSAVVTTDAPLKWQEQDKTMLIERSGSCGFEGDPEFQYALVTLANPEAMARTLSPVQTVVADSSGSLWLGDGAVCESPGARPPASLGYVWTSPDAGKTWSPVGVPVLGAVSQIVSRGPVLVALSQRCYDTVSWGGNVAFSVDRGKSWHAAYHNQEFVNGSEGIDGAFFSQIEILSVQPLRIRAFRRQLPVTDSTPLFEPWEAVLDPKLGPQVRTKGPLEGPWRRVAVRALPSRTDDRAVLGGRTFRATEDGLVEDGTEGTTTVFRTVEHYLALDRTHVFADLNDDEERKVIPAPPTPPGPWESGCRTRDWVLASGERAERELVQQALGVVNVSPSDHLHLRAAATARSTSLAQLAYDESGLVPTGLLCKMEGVVWVQLVRENLVGWASTRFLGPVTSSHDFTAKYRPFVPTTPQASPAQFSRRIIEAREKKFGGRREGHYETKLEGISVTGGTARATFRSCCELDDSVRGQLVVVEMKKAKGGWIYVGATGRYLCYRGVGTGPRVCS